MNIYFVLVKIIIGGEFEKVQKIWCSVYDCKYCDVYKDLCKKKEIKVSTCRADDEKESTMCDNYKKIKLD